MLTRTTVGLIQKGCNFQEKCWSVAELYPIWKLKEYTYDYWAKCSHNSHKLVEILMTEVTANFPWRNFT